MAEEHCELKPQELKPFLVYALDIRMHEWPWNQANLHASKQIILHVFSCGYGLNIYLNL